MIHETHASSWASHHKTAALRERATWSSSVTIATTRTMGGVSGPKVAPHWANRASIASIPFAFRRSYAI